VLSVRLFARRHPRFIGLIFAFVLAAKLLIPAGYMTNAGDHGIVMQMCSGHGSVVMAAPVGGKIPKSALVDRPCVYAFNSIGAVPAVAPSILAIVIAFILALGFAPIPFRPIARFGWFLPPLRGPPLSC
jgi:hypothetical protein